MTRQIFTPRKLIAPLLATLLSLGATLAAHADDLRVLVHSSFSLPKPLLAQFETDSGIKLAIF